MPSSKPPPSVLEFGRDVGYPDMVQMDSLTADSILDNVHRRYLHDAVYTAVSSILIAVNPYHSLPHLYDHNALHAFHHLPPTSPPPPHIFSIARSAYLRALGINSPTGPRSQSILISGESGAGKTEATKHILAYIAHASAASTSPNPPPHLPPASPSPHTASSSTLTSHMAAALSSSLTHHVEARLLQANPILEAFGNAKTLRNNNSSRFGKYVRVHLARDGRVVGGEVQSYLLETSRVVGQGQGERNYNVFYHLLAARGVGVGEFRYLKQSGCTVIEGMDERAMYDGVVQAMTVIGLTAAQQVQVMDVVMGILHLGNCTFTPSGKEGCEVAEGVADDLAAAARMLGLSEGALSAGLTTKVLVSPRSTIIHMPRSVKEAEETRDSMAKLIYSNLMAYLITKINAALSPSTLTPTPHPLPSSPPSSSPSPAAAVTIGILDIFGFESFPLNSLEQLLINYANERLHQHFLNAVFKLERQLYEAEGIKLGEGVAGMRFEDNQPVLDVLDKKGVGVLPLLHDELFIPKGSDANLLAKAHAAHASSPVYVKPRVGGADRFGVMHYAGTVEYAVAGMLDKNRSKVGEQLVVLFEGARGEVMRDMFGVTDSDEADAAAAASPTPTLPLTKGAGRWDPPVLPGPVASPPASRQGSVSVAASRVSVSSLFGVSLNELLGEIAVTEAHFVRCMKPNGEKRPGVVDVDMLRGQLMSSGVVDAVRVRKDGYSERMPISTFLRTYSSLITHPTTQRTADKDRVQLIMDAVCPGGGKAGGAWALGTSRVFYKAHVHAALEGRRREQLGWAAVKVQKMVRGWLVRRRQREVQRQCKAINAALQAGQLSAVDGLLAQAKADGCLPPSHLAAATKLRNLLSAGVKAGHALTQALTAPAASLRDRLHLLDTATAVAGKLERPPYPSWWPTLAPLQRAVAEVTRALRTLAAALQAGGDDAEALARTVADAEAAITAALTPTRLSPASLLPLSSLSEVASALTQASRSHRLVTDLRTAIDARDLPALRATLASSSSSTSPLPPALLDEAHLCHDALALAEAVDAALEQWTSSALLSIIAQIRSLLPTPSPSPSSPTPSPLDPYLPAGVTLASLLALLDASLVALESEMEASTAAHRALTGGDHWKLTMALQRAEDALYMKKHSRRKVRGGEVKGGKGGGGEEGGGWGGDAAEGGLEKLVKEMKKEMTKLEALAAGQKDREVRQQAAVDGLRGAMASSDVGVIDAAIDAAEGAGVGKEQLAHARSHRLTVDTIRLLQAAIEGREEGVLREALEVSTRRLKDHALDVRSREYHDRHQQAKATLEQLMAVAKVHEREEEVRRVERGRVNKGKASSPRSGEEQDDEWRAAIDQLREAIAASRLCGARDADIGQALELTHRYEAVHPSPAIVLVDDEEVAREEAAARERERILEKLRPQLQGAAVMLPMAMPSRRGSVPLEKKAGGVEKAEGEKAKAKDGAEGGREEGAGEQEKGRGRRGTMPPPLPPVKKPTVAVGGPPGGLQYSYDVRTSLDGEEGVSAAIEAALRVDGGGGSVGAGQVVPFAPVKPPSRSARSRGSSVVGQGGAGGVEMTAAERQGMERVLRVSQAEWQFDVEELEKSQLRKGSLAQALKQGEEDDDDGREEPQQPKPAVAPKATEGEVAVPRESGCCCVIS